MPKLGLGLGLGPRNNKQYLSFDEKNRIIYDGGIVRNLKALEDTLKFFNTLMPNTKLLYCPELGVKLRSSGINNYVTKLYDVGPGMLDGSQTTALNQPFLSGNIAPNEKYAIDNPNGANAYLTHTPISFSSTDKWSVSFVLNNYHNANFAVNKLCFYGQSTIRFQDNGATLCVVNKNGIATVFSNSSRKFIGKNSHYILSADGLGNMSFYIDGKLITTNTFSTEFEFNIVFSSNQSVNGALKYYSIRDIALSPTQIQDEYNYLRTLFPEIESVQIGTQTWATSNCEMTCTPQGNVIQEMQAATNVEKITNYVNREFSSDTGFWYKSGQNPPTIAGGMCNINCPAGSDSYIAANIPLIIGRYYKVIYSIKRNSAGSLSVFSGGGTPIDSSVGDTKVAYFIANHSSSFALGRRVSPTDIDVDNVYVQEVGWADSTNLYNYVYANTSGTAEQKEYAAVKAAAMWCYYNNDPALGAIYGKLYNWYAVRLLQMDIDYYNAANPTTPWGWRIPASADFTTLFTYLGGNTVAGGKMKKEGLDYWNTPNSGADNNSGLSLLGAGWRESTGIFANNKAQSKHWNTDRGGLTAVNNSAASYIASSEPMLRGYSLRLIKA